MEQGSDLAAASPALSTVAKDQQGAAEKSRSCQVRKREHAQEFTGLFIMFCL